MASATPHKPDIILLATTSLLLLLGILILSSASLFFAQQNVADPFYYLQHQLLFGVLPGLTLGLLAYLLPRRRLKSLSLPALAGALLLSVLVFVPALGMSEGGATRWLRLGSFSLQPAELLKGSFLVYLAAWLSSRNTAPTPKRRAETPNRLVALVRAFGPHARQLVPFGIILGGIAAVLLAQSDLSTLGVIAVSAVAMYFVAGTPIWHTAVITGGAGALFLYFILFSSYRMNRIAVLFNPGLEPQGAGYQLKQALIAIGSGGLTGSGLGLSQQKLGFIPQPITDSIFAVLAEEAGFLGSVVLLLLFGILLWRGLRISKLSPKPFPALLAAGITIQLVVQALINIGALIRLFPLTGIPLPLISYGGTALVVSLIEIGLLLNMSRYTEEPS